MDDLNVVIQIGRLVFDPEVKVSTTGKKKVKIRIAVSRGKDAKGNDKGAYFFNGQMFGKTADAMAKWGAKGRRINIQGKLCEWKYDKDGETRTYTVINVDTFRFLDKPKTKSGSADPQNGPPVETYDENNQPTNEAARRAQERGGAAAAARDGGAAPSADDDDIPF